MNNEVRMERNLVATSLRITEIPPNGEYQKILCPICHKPFSAGIEQDGTCKKVTTYCKMCHRTFSISTEEVAM
jgi:hypothetical protein